MKKLLVLGFALIFLFNCKKDDAPINCDEVACTEIFVTLWVTTKRDINRTLVFKGYINEEEVASAEYVVTADCCHISLVSGNTDIIIE